MKKIYSLVGIFAAAALSIAPFGVNAQTAVYAEPNIFAGRDMYVGVTGSDVTELQGLLQELGYLQVPENVPLGYFGPLTQKGLANYQASLGVINTGYFGPLTKTAMKTSFASHGWLHLLYPNTY